MNFADTSVCVFLCVCVCVRVGEGGGASVTERERQREINQTSTRLRETQPSYRPVGRKPKPAAERAGKTGSGLRERAREGARARVPSRSPSNNNIVYTREEPLLSV